MRLLKGAACRFDRLPRGHGLFEYRGVLYYKTRHEGTYLLATGEHLRTEARYWPEERPHHGPDELCPDSLVTPWAVEHRPEDPVTRDP